MRNKIIDRTLAGATGAVAAMLSVAGGGPGPLGIVGGMAVVALAVSRGPAPRDARMFLLSCLSTYRDGSAICFALFGWPVSQTAVSEHGALRRLRQTLPGTAMVLVIGARRIAVILPADARAAPALTAARRALAAERGADEACSPALTFLTPDTPFEPFELLDEAEHDLDRKIYCQSRPPATPRIDRHLVTCDLSIRPRVCSDLGHVTGLAVSHEKVGGGVRATVREASAARNNDMALLAAGADLVRRLRAMGLEPGRLCVPLLRVQLGDADLPDRVAMVLDAHDLGPSDLELVVEHPDASARVYDDLSAMGCRISLPAASDAARRGDGDLCWIGAAMTRDIASDPARRGLVSGVLRRAERQGLLSVATGVQTAPEAALLAQLGCSMLQGSAISPVLREDQVADWLRGRQPVRSGDPVLPWLMDVDALEIPNLILGPVAKTRSQPPPRRLS